MHIVLAKLPDAPKGTKGLSLFIIPKILARRIWGGWRTQWGLLWFDRKKMGIHGNGTALLNFDNAKGF